MDKKRNLCQTYHFMDIDQKILDFLQQIFGFLTNVSNKFLIKISTIDKNVWPKIFGNFGNKMKVWKKPFGNN